jgi:methyltransferase
MNIEEFEKIMQRDDKEEKEEDLEKIWDDKSEWFFKRTEKNKEIFQIDLFLK